MKIDFVSDVACPWCAIGLNSLERALERLGPDIPVELEFQPFELNPDMAPEGADAAEYLRSKYGMSAEQLASNRARIKQLGANVGFSFGERAHVWNTFDAHRLLHWAGLQGGDHQRKLKHALLQAYHGEGRNPSAQDVLVQAATEAGLDATRAAAILSPDEYTEEVRAAEEAWREAGISSVPAIIIDRKHLISGGQPPEVFERALRQVAALPAET